MDGKKMPAGLNRKGMPTLAQAAVEADMSISEFNP